MTAFCPQFGKAISGICESYAKRIIHVCNLSGLSVDPAKYFWNSANLRGQLVWGVDQPRVVPDNSRFCLKEPTWELSGHFEEVCCFIFIKSFLSLICFSHLEPKIVPGAFCSRSQLRTLSIELPAVSILEH